MNRDNCVCCVAFEVGDAGFMGDHHRVMTRRSICLVLTLTACGPSVLPGEEGSTSAASSTTSVASATSPPPAVTTSVDTSTAPPSLDSSDDADTIEPPILDDWPRVDLPAEHCEPIGPQGMPGVNLDYIWTPSPYSGTLSKIDTVSLAEVGRYRASPSGFHTINVSVALSGAVAVATGGAGVAKFYATDCPDPVNTSTGPDDVYDWGDDGCLAWFSVFNTRAVAWAPGTYDQEACAWVDETLWVAEQLVGGDINVHRIDGDTGMIVASALVEDLTNPTMRTGAVDSDGNFWIISKGPGQLVRVDALSLATETWDMPGYASGIVVEPGYGIWICGRDGLMLFDPSAETFDMYDPDTLGLDTLLRGCASDGTSLWLSGFDRLWQFRLDTLEMEYETLLIGGGRGLAVDWTGAVWAVPERGAHVSRFWPDTMDFDMIEVAEPDAQSDMTGRALAHSMQ